MGYQVYEDHNAAGHGVARWAGYGVPAKCDVADCEEEIDRGLGYKCDEVVTYTYTEGDADDDVTETETVGEGCGLFFCSKHESHSDHGDDVIPKSDTPEWEHWMLTDESWAQWRSENPQLTFDMSVRDQERAQ